MPPSRFCLSRIFSPRRLTLRGEKKELSGIRTRSHGRLQQMCFHKRQMLTNRQYYQTAPKLSVTVAMILHNMSTYRWTALGGTDFSEAGLIWKLSLLIGDGNMIASSC